MTIDPKEFELGEDVTDQVVRSKAPGLVVSARLDREDATRLFALAKRTDRTPSQISREALRRYLAEADKAAVFQGEATWTATGIWLSNAKPGMVTGALKTWHTKIVGPTTPSTAHIVSPLH